MGVRLGIDCGTTLMKALLDDNGEILFRTNSLDDLLHKLDNYSISDVYLTGIGSMRFKLLDYFKDLSKDIKIHQSQKGDIETELLYQVNGLQDAFVIDKIPNPRSYYLVSIGTGTSYTVVKDDLPSILPYGSAFGGGVIYNLGCLLSLSSPGSLRQHIFNFNNISPATVLDTFSSELIPEDQMVNDPNKVISHFNNAKLFSGDNNLFETTVHMVGYTIVQELMMQLGGKPELKTAVCIGTTLTTFGKRLIPHLEKYFKMYGVELITLSPELSPYVGALGALHIP